ncbi:hypothetical protein L7F22_052269 [Adiantum nelumboides]|nr:hypothetical protein [Adiantum nelumboides]
MEISAAGILHISTVVGTQAAGFGRSAVLTPAFTTFEGMKGVKGSCAVPGLEDRRHSHVNNVPRVKAVAAPVKAPTSLHVKRSKVEIFKEQSNYLRFPLKEELETEAPNINEAAVQLIKFHGSYQQDNREDRAGGKSYQFMLRTKQPSGKVSNILYLVMDDLADQFGIGTLRLTTRQTFQLHGVLKHNLKTVMGTIIKNMGSTLGACGDLNRNVLAPPAPFVRKDYLFAQETADKIAALLAPQAGSYYDLWVDGEKIMSADPPDVIEALKDNSHGTNFEGSPEPIYGTQFLPRKFKVAVTVPTDNSVDILTNDVGLVVLCDDDGEPKGFNIYDTTFLWWNRRVADGKRTPSWQKFRSAIRKAFEPTNADFHARSSLRRLSQTGSLAAYITEFQRLTLEIETLSPSDKLHSFIDGLEPNLKDDVHKFDPATLDAAIAYVERLGDSRRQGRNFFPGERSFNNNRSFQRDNRGRYSQNQQRSSQNYQPARQSSSRQFFGNQSSGQQSFRDKRPLLKQDPLPTVLGIEDGLAKTGDVMTAEIFKGRLLLDSMLLLFQHHPPLSQVDQDYAPFAVVIIGDKGKQAVRAVRVSKVVSALMLNANTNVSVPVNLSNQVLSLLGFVGNHPLNVLVDSGCSTNFVSTMLVSKLRLPTQQSVEAFQVELADGSYLQCNKKVQQLEFQIQDYKDQLGFSVMPLSHYDMILGQSWLYQYDPIISFRDHTIRLFHRNQEVELRDKDFGDAFRVKSLNLTTAEINMFASYTVMDELLYYLDRICVPHNGALRKILIEEHHEVPFAAHPRINKTYRFLSATYFWPQIQQDVIKYVKACHSCQIMKASRQLPQGLLQPLPVPKERWESISMDFITTLPRTSKGNAQILVIVDRFSKMAHFIPCKKAASAPDIASLFVQHIFRIHGLPRSIISDGDPKFTRHFWTSLFKSLGTNLLFSSAYHPQTDGQTERVNQILEEILRHYIQNHLASWEEYLPLVEFVYNIAPHSVTGMTPFQAAYGHTPLVPTNFVLQHKVALAYQLVQEMQDILIQIIKKNSVVSYKLELPPSWGKLHPTFHISWLKQYSQGDSLVPELSSYVLEIEDEHVILVPEMILDVRQKETRRKLTTEFLVKWMDLDESDSTWQTDEEMQQYPNLLQEFFDKRQIFL